MPETPIRRGLGQVIAAFNRHWDACRQAGFNPAQPRVPAGNPDGGQWTSEEGNGGTGGDVSKPVNRVRLADAGDQINPSVQSDATPDWIPGAQYAQNRAGRGPIFVNGQWVQPTPAQAARLAVAEARVQEAISRVREVDPKWKASPSSYDTVEGLIKA